MKQILYDMGNSSGYFITLSLIGEKVWSPSWQGIGGRGDHLYVFIYVHVSEHSEHSGGNDQM